MKCSRDINFGRGGTRDLRIHQETKLHKHSERDGVGVLPLQSYFGPIREESVIRAEVLFAYFLGEHHLAFQFEDHFVLLGRVGTRDLRIHPETKLHKHSERDGVGVLPLQSYFGSIREESVIRAEVLFAYFLGEHHLTFQLGDHFTKLFMLMFPDSCIAKDSVLKVIAHDCWKIISAAVRETKYFSLQTDETTNITVTQQAAIMLR